VKYSTERREALLKKMLPPHNKPIGALAKEEGVSAATLYNWRQSARAAGRLLPDGDVTPEGWSSRDKFNAVLETAALNETELAEYCRRRGIYAEQIKSWRHACEVANAREEACALDLNRSLKHEQQRIKELTKELHRKEKALAETAALLVLRKKAAAIWGDSEDA
jgi:transposase-like protein